MATPRTAEYQSTIPLTREEIKELSQPKDHFINVSQPERWASVIGGALLTAYGVSRGTNEEFLEGGWTGWALALAGTALVYRGATGHCDVYATLGVNTSNGQSERASVHHGAGIKVEKSVIINKPAAELYQYWRNLENLPRFMKHLEAVQKLDEKRSHWIAKAPMGYQVEWDAEIINEEENELIAWRSLDGSEIPNAGSVRFETNTNGRGTIVKVALSYEPPAGKIGALVAKLFGEEPNRQVEEDLRRFKQLLETGEIATTEGQPSGRTKTQSGS